MISKFKNNKGFTLVELLVAVGLFVVVATFSLGSVLTIFDANRKAQSSRTVVDNLNLSIENMARTIRFGGNYYCGASSDTTVPIETLDCSSGGDTLSVTFNSARIIYRLNGTPGTNANIQRSDDGGSNYTTITSTDTVIDYLKFYVFNTTPRTSGDTSQPYIIFVIRGHVGVKPTIQTSFSIETLISQRTLDL